MDENEKTVWPEKLETVLIDIPNKRFEVNGKSFGEATEVSIDFENGIWYFVSYLPQRRKGDWGKYETDGTKLAEHRNPSDFQIQIDLDKEVLFKTSREKSAGQNGYPLNSLTAEKYIPALQGLRYCEWVKLKTAIDRSFEKSIGEFEKTLKLTDTEAVARLIRSQFG